MVFKTWAIKASPWPRGHRPGRPHEEGAQGWEEGKRPLPDLLSEHPAKRAVRAASLQKPLISATFPFKAFFLYFLANKTLKFYKARLIYTYTLMHTMMSPESEVAQPCPTLCDPMDCSPPGSSVQGIFQARTLEWGAISFSRGSSQLRDQTWVSRIVGRRFYCLSHWGCLLHGT